ncbi:MAG: VWA domain-containing protein [Deltaproteobacteria bacterium]
MLRLFTLLIAIFAPFFAFADGRTMIVLDASGSMWGQIDGKTKVEIARETLASVLKDISPDEELGLVVYGHRTKGDCGDIEVAVPAAKGTAQSIIDFANNTKFLGKTPLSDAVQMAADSLHSTEEKATVILVTDGLETCGGDPCALGTALEGSGVDFTAHVVGFGLSDEEGKQVACLADNTGGKYFAAKDAAGLSEALSQVVAVEPEPEPMPEPKPQPAAVEFNFIGTTSLTDGGPALDNDAIYWEIVPVVDGKPAEKTADYTYGATYKISQPAGDYIVRAKLDKIEIEQAVTLADDATTEITLNLNAGHITLTGTRTPGGDVDDNIYVEAGQGDVVNYAYGTLKAYVSAGEITLKGSQAKGEASRTITLNAGDDVTEEIVVGTGVVGLTALYAPGGPAFEDSNLFLEILSSKKKIDGSQDSFGYIYGPGKLDIPAGEYIVQASIDKVLVRSEPFTVTSGERIDLEIVMNAGVAAISAPGAKEITIYAAAKDINGERATMKWAYGEELSATLAPGTYVAETAYESDKAPGAVTFDAVAGERVEVAVP